METARKTISRADGRILIVGGYGMVGHCIAAWLAPRFPGRVTVAGRNFDKARATATGIGYGAEALAVDIFASDQADMLDGVILVIVCLDQINTQFVKECLARGIHYVDICANYKFLSDVEKLDGLAIQSGATAILSVGVSPGLTNLLAARLCETMADVDRIDILLELGLGDHHGKAAIMWMLDNIDTDYVVTERGQTKSVRSFAESLDFSLPGQAVRPAYRFDFSDQHVIGQTLGVPTVSTWFRFGDRLSTWFFAQSSQVGFGRFLRIPFCRAVAVWLFQNIHFGSDRCGVAVQATGRGNDGSKTMTIGLIGRQEALMTAIVAAETTRQILCVKPVPGVHHSEKVIALDPVITALKEALPDIVIAL